MKECDWSGLGQTGFSMLMTQSTQVTGHENGSDSSSHLPVLAGQPDDCSFSVGSLETLSSCDVPLCNSPQMPL